MSLHIVQPSRGVLFIKNISGNINVSGPHIKETVDGIPLTYLETDDCRKIVYSLFFMTHEQLSVTISLRLILIL